MPGSLATRAEVTKTARLLGVDAPDLSYLERLPIEDLRELRELITDALFRAGRGPMRRIATAASVTPTAIAASLAERVFGPLLCARMAGEVDSEKAAEIAKRLPDAFLAEVAVELDPRRASDVIGRIPVSRMTAVARELARRREYVTLGRFVGHVSDASLRAAIGVLDEEALLRTAFVVEGKDRLDAVVGSLPEERLRGLIRVAAEKRLWPETLDLLSHLDPALRGRLADIAASEPDQVLSTLVDAAAREDLGPDLEPLAERLPPQVRARLERGAQRAGGGPKRG